MTFELNNMRCQVCGTSTLQLIDDYKSLFRITSDCKPFPAGGKLALCMNCGAVQKIPDAKWFGEISEIYAKYQAYEIADGEEQLVFDQIAGQPRKRSVVLTERLRRLGWLPEVAKTLDVGCGDGVTLRAMCECFPGWALNGHELGSSKEPKLKAIPGFAQLFSGDLESLPVGFDVISMVHSLEHFPSPFTALQTLHKKLHDGGFLFIEVCNVEENPFDLLVADHLMHFSPASLTRLVERAGFCVRRCETEWVKKEISIVAQKAEGAPVSLDVSAEPVFRQISKSVFWLEQLALSAREAAASAESFGIFGTSIAASWLTTELGDRVKFFVDEDPNRVGRSYMGKPVFSPSDVPDSSLVYLALAPTLAASISERLGNHRWTIISPPAL